VHPVEPAFRKAYRYAQTRTPDPFRLVRVSLTPFNPFLAYRPRCARWWRCCSAERAGDPDRQLSTDAAATHADHPAAAHIFTHRQYAYPFEVRDETDWMTCYFFTGGIMPSDDLLLYFQRDVRIVEHWQVPGWHYQLTSEAWLANMDRHRAELMRLLASTCGEAEALRWRVYWRVFFMACAELWGCADGREGLVSHYLFERR
jgi:hypothetical protein